MNPEDDIKPAGTDGLKDGVSSPVVYHSHDGLDSPLVVTRIPLMTTTERNAIKVPYKGQLIYNTTTNKLNVYTTAWEAITSA